jgi:hypothetical protein
MSRIEIVIDEIVLDGMDIRRESALREAVHAAVSRSLAGAPIAPRAAKPAVAAQVATSVTGAVAARGGRP